MYTVILYGYEFAGHQHELVYETDAETFTDVDENQICYLHDEDDNAWLGYVISILQDDDENLHQSFDMSAMLFAQQKIKEIKDQHFSEFELDNTYQLLHIIRD